jgi:hypothetical protein
MLSSAGEGLIKPRISQSTVAEQYLTNLETSAKINHQMSQFSG